jgi:hypothetical protein
MALPTCDMPAAAPNPGMAKQEEKKNPKSRGVEKPIVDSGSLEHPLLTLPLSRRQGFSGTPWLAWTATDSILKPLKQIGH